jgi:hypothetical protein
MIEFGTVVVVRRVETELCALRKAILLGSAREYGLERRNNGRIELCFDGLREP